MKFVEMNIAMVFNFLIFQICDAKPVSDCLLDQKSTETEIIKARLRLFGNAINTSQTIR